MLHVWGTGGVRTEFWCGSVRERYHLEDPGLNVKVKLKWILRKLAERPSGLDLFWPRIGTISGLF